jgi:hypothetical protein
MAATDDRPEDRVVRKPATPADTNCYLCGTELQRDEKVVRVHETTMHRDCYEKDIRRGR